MSLRGGRDRRPHRDDLKPPARARGRGRSCDPPPIFPHRLSTPECWKRRASIPSSAGGSPLRGLNDAESKRQEVRTFWKSQADPTPCNCTSVQKKSRANFQRCKKLEPYGFPRVFSAGRARRPTAGPEEILHVTRNYHPDHSRYRVARGLQRHRRRSVLRHRLLWRRRTRPHRRHPDDSTTSRQTLSSRSQNGAELSDAEALAVAQRHQEIGTPSRSFFCSA